MDGLLSSGNGPCSEFVPREAETEESPSLKRFNLLPSELATTKLEVSPRRYQLDMQILEIPSAGRLTIVLEAPSLAVELCD